MTTDIALAPNEFPCNKCGKTIIFVTTTAGKSMPIDPFSWDGEEMYNPKKHRSHFKTCVGKAREVSVIVIETVDEHAKAVVVPRGFQVEFRKPEYAKSGKDELAQETIV